MWAEIAERAPCVVAAALVAAMAGLLAPNTSVRAAEPDLTRLHDTYTVSTAATDQLARLVKDLGLSWLHGPLGDSLAVPLAGTGVIHPYAAIGGSLGLTRLNDPLVPYQNLSRLGDSTELGAGLSWKLTDRLEFFGEYRFLSIRPTPDDPGRSSSDPDANSQVQGGLSIRF